jgi:hypothetical protein
MVIPMMDLIHEITLWSLTAASIVQRKVIFYDPFEEETDVRIYEGSNLGD